MKKKFLAVFMAFVLLFCLTGCGARGTNVEIESSTLSTVTYYLVCPYCGSEGDLETVDLSYGLSCEGSGFCIECGSSFEFSIKR